MNNTLSLQITISIENSRTRINLLLIEKIKTQNSNKAKCIFFFFFSLINLIFRGYGSIDGTLASSYKQTFAQKLDKFIGSV
jgi:hypothetical protein